MLLAVTAPHFCWAKGAKKMAESTVAQETKTIRAIIIVEGWRRRVRSQMADLREMRDPDSSARIDTVGWLFSAATAAIIAVLIAYKANDTRIANGPVSQVDTRWLLGLRSSSGARDASKQLGPEPCPATLS